MEKGMEKTKIKPPSKQIVATWISKGIKQLQEHPDMMFNSFDVCGITSTARFPSEPEHDVYPDSTDELDDPFNEIDSFLTNEEL